MKFTEKQFNVFMKLLNSKKGYIDPSTGIIMLSTMWSAIVAALATTIAFVIKWFWNPIKEFFTK